ncbi:MAG: HAD family hydrolase [Pseudomonadota bacterium]
MYENEIHYCLEEEVRSTLILCDFDGTLTNRDTLPLFLRFAGGFRFYFYLPLLVSFVILYKLKVMTAQQAKEALLSCLFKGCSEDDLNTLGARFSHILLSNKDRYFRKKALEYLCSERDKGSRIVIVSASPDTWITPFAKSLGIELISSRLQYHKGFFTGKFHGKNCNNQEKVARIRAEIPELSSYFIKSFGDTEGDAAMLRLAHEKYYRFFK